MALHQLYALAQGLKDLLLQLFQNSSLRIRKDFLPLSSSFGSYARPQIAEEYPTSQGDDSLCEQVVGT
jgi:hypothetical protein